MLSVRLPAISKPRLAHIMLCVSLLLAHLPAAAADYVLVAHKGVQVNSLTREDVRSIFLGELTKWNDGKAVRFATLEEGRIHRIFMQEVVGKTAQQYLNYWRRKIFNGEALAPKSFLTAGEQVGFVKTTPGAIGYVSSDEVIDSVKIISIK